MRKNTNPLKNNEGYIMLESLWVLVVTTIVLCFLFSMLFIYYQQWSLRTIADDAAAQVAQTYKTPYAEMDGYMTEAQIKKIDIYRYNKEDIRLLNEQRVKKYVKQRAKAIFITTSRTEPQTTLKINKDSHARRHATVTIKGSYVVPFGGIMKLAGGKGAISYEVSSTAECVDLLDYMNMIDYINQVASDTFGSVIIKFINSILSMINKFTK